MSQHPRTSAFAPRLIAAATMSESSVIVLVPLGPGVQSQPTPKLFSQQFPSLFLPSRFFPSPTAPSLHVRLFYCSQNPRRATDSRTSALIIRRNLRIESLARLVRSKFVAVASRKEEFSTTVGLLGFRYHVTLFKEVLHPPSL